MAGSAPRPAETSVPGDLEPAVMAEIDRRIEVDMDRELEKVRGWGKVKTALDQRKARKLARTVLKKANFGPLDEKSSRRRGSRRESGEKAVIRGERGRHRRSAKEEEAPDGDGVVVGRREIGGRFKEKVMEDQEDELDELRSMKVVKKHLAKRETFARARRMFNRRVVPRPASARHTSFLVSGYEEPASEDVADYIRQQSVVVIDNFFNIPPKERRVLDRLTSTQMHWISDAELGKVQARQSGQLAEEEEEESDDEISVGRTRGSEPTEMLRVYQQLEPEKKSSKRKHHIRKSKKHTQSEEDKEKPSAKKESKRKKQKGESRWHRWGVVKKGVTEEPATQSRQPDREERRLRRSQGHSEGQVSRAEQTRRRSWMRRERERGGPAEQYQETRESGAVSRPSHGSNSVSLRSSSGSFQEPASPESIPLAEPQPQPTSRSTQESHGVTSGDHSGNTREVTSPRAYAYQDSICEEGDDEQDEEDVFYGEQEEEEDEFCDCDCGDSQQTLSSQLPPTLAPPGGHLSVGMGPPLPPALAPPGGHLSVGMGPPPPPGNAHTTTTSITDESHRTHAQTPSTLDCSSEDSEIHAQTEERYAYGYFESRDSAVSEYLQNSYVVGHEEDEQKAKAMEHDLMWEGGTISKSEEEANELLHLVEEREEYIGSSLGPPESQEQPPSRHLVPDYSSPCPTVTFRDTAKDQPNGSPDTTSPKPMMFSISGSSQTSSFDDSHSNHSTGSSKYRRFFSSPQLSLTSAENSLHLPSHPYMTGLSLYPRTPHGYYSYDEEVNPFSVQFQEALKESEEQTQERLVRSQNRGEAAAFTSQQTSASASRHQSTDLPPHLLDDPNFRIFLAGLDHKPTKSDYISYKIALIGDAIDAKYDTQLNQALDALFTEVLKNTITWDSFSRAAKKLMLQGQHIQDGIFMIPCFGRRLLEFVPQLRGTITGYTQRVMDNSWDLILTSGGWNAMMEGYSQPELRPEYEDWGKRWSHEEGQGQMDVVGAMGYDLFSPDPENRGLAVAIAAAAAEKAMPYERTPHTLPRSTGAIPPLPVPVPLQRNQPHSLDDVIRHPRVVDPHCLFPDPLTSERSPLFRGHLRRRVKSVEVLLSQTEDETPENDYHIPAALSRLDSRRHSSPGIHSDGAFFIPRVSSPIPIPSVRAYDPASQEELSSTPHIISIGNGRHSPVMEFFSREETAVVETRHGFISVSHAISHTHSRDGSISSIGSCSTIHIVTGEETLVEDLPVTQPVSPDHPNGDQLDGHGRSHSGASAPTDSLNHLPGSGPGSSHCTGGSRAAEKTANSYSTSDYMDLGFDTLDFARRGRPARSSTDSVFTSDTGSGEWRTAAAGSPKQRRRRRSSLQVVSESIAAVGPILTHAAIGVFAVLFTGQQ